MKLKTLLLIVFTVSIISACSGSKAVNNNSSNTSGPSWFYTPPMDTEEFFYAVGVAEATRLSMASRMAENSARQAMATKLEAKVSALEKSFTEEVQSGADANYSATFSNAGETLVNETLSGVTRDEMQCTDRDREETGGNVNTQCFVMVRMPVGVARSSFENALSKDEELYTKFKASQAFQELQNRLHEDIENN